MPERRLATRLFAAFLAAQSPAMADVCAQPPDYAATDPELAQLLNHVLPELPRFPSLLQALATGQPEICLDDRSTGALGYYEPGTNRIAIGADLASDLQAYILIHEIRHADQHDRGLCPEMSLSMRDYARAIWAMEADAATTALMVTWDMAQRGDPGPFSALAAHAGYGDMAARFSETMIATGSFVEGGSAAFVAWYSDVERRHDYFVASCSTYLDEQESTHALPRYGALDPGFFEMLCVLPDGRPYDCSEPPSLTH